MYCINRLVSIIETKGIYRAVRADSQYNSGYSYSFKGFLPYTVIPNSTNSSK
jgi:hypothetical protein